MNSQHRLDTVVIHDITLRQLSALGRQAARAAHHQHIVAGRLAPTPSGTSRSDERDSGDGPSAATPDRQR